MGTTTRGYPYPELADVIDNGIGPFEAFKSLADAIDGDVGNFGVVQYDKSGATVQVVNTVTETDLYRKTIPANLLGVGGALRMLLSGDLLNNTGAGVDYRIRVKFGATTLFDVTQTGVVASATRGIWNVEAFLLNGATNAQVMRARSMVRSGTSTVSAGVTSESNVFFGDLAAAEDTTGAKDLAVTITLGTANANADIRRHFAHLERVNHS